jgi:hypothetical protein
MATTDSILNRLEILMNMARQSTPPGVVVGPEFLEEIAAEIERLESALDDVGDMNFERDLGDYS